MDKNNLRLQLIEDLSDIVITAKFGIDYWYTAENGDQRMIPAAQDYYNIVQEDIEDLIANYERDIETLQR